MTVVTGIVLYLVGWLVSSYFLTRQTTTPNIRRYSRWDSGEVFIMNTFWPIMIFAYAGFLVIKTVTPKEFKS